MFMIMFVLDDPDKLSDVMDAWERVGVSGVTILESSGLHRHKCKHIPLRFLPAVYETQENHVTLFTLVKNEALIQACLEAAESITGNLDEPNTGIFTAWPVSFLKGAGSEGGS